MRGNFKRVFSLDKKIEPLPSSWQGEVTSRALTLDRTYHDLNLHPRELGVWTEKHTRELDVTNFRADNVYVWQKRDLAIEKLTRSNKEIYIEAARIYKQMEEKKECTFKPKVN